MKKFQVVIVGGGPVGVALAVQLGMRGISCALVESRTELGSIPKGQNLTHRTLEHFYFMGIVDELRAVHFVIEIEDWLGIELIPEIIYDYPSTDALAGFLADWGRRCVGG